jgi:hypothetical protein
MPMANRQWLHSEESAAFICLIRAAVTLLQSTGPRSAWQWSPAGSLTVRSDDTGFFLLRTSTIFERKKLVPP